MSLPPFIEPERPAVGALLDFSGKVVLVSGARKGIGQGIASRFAEAGADVIVHVRSPGDGAETIAAVEGWGRRGVEAAGDLREDAVLGGLGAAAEALGGLHVLVNNAGAYPVEPIETLDPARFAEIVDINLTTAFRLTRWCAGLWAEKGGAVVNVSSIEATRPAFGHAHYASAKAALEMLTRVAAVELGPKVRVNAVAPGLVHYPELAELWPEGVARYRERAILGREGERIEIADACLFLASEASSWMTGAVVPVDGGVSAAPHF